MEFADEPVTLLYAPATDEVKKIAQQLHGVVIDDEANAYVLFFRRSTFPVSSFSVGMQAYAGLNPVSKDIKGGSSTKKINSYFAAAVSAMLRMNIWLQSGDTYARYTALDRNSSAMLVTATESGISARVVTGKERPNLQCENLLNMQALRSSPRCTHP